MNARILISMLAAAVISVLAEPAEGCSTFCLAGAGPVFGKNYDWDVADGLVIVNKRGVAKTAMTSDNPAKWTSTLGSVTFNQYGREMPCGGINEAGLVIELMWLDDTLYPPADSRQSLYNLQWIQYHLDVSSSVDDVIARDADIRIAPGREARVHFLVADRTGACATIEYLGGKMVAHTGETMPVMALTNHTYEQSVAFLKLHEGFGGAVPPGDSNRSLDRFVRAASAVAAFDANAPDYVITYAFDVLASVAQGPSTQWSIVYDLGAMRVYFRTATRPSVRFFDVGNFDYSCQTPVRILDLAADVKGDVSGSFVSYSFDANKKLIDSAFGQTSFLKDVTAGSRNALARYPAITRCVH